jgi:predicted DNA-binding transcriptional regulator AlpA
MEVFMQVTPLLRTPDAARYCGVAKSTFEKLRCSGEGPRFIRRGRSVLYALENLDAWIQSLPRFTSTSEPNSRSQQRQTHRSEGGNT